MLGIGWTEMLVVGVVALIVIGPKELPALMQKLGRFAGTVRRMGSDFQRELNRTTGLNEVTNLRNAITQPLKSTTDAIRKEFNTTTSSGEVKPSGALKPAEAGSESVVKEIHAAAGMKTSEAATSAPVKAAAAATGAASFTAISPSSASPPPTKPELVAKPKAKRSRKKADTGPVDSSGLATAPEKTPVSKRARAKKRASKPVSKSAAKTAVAPTSARSIESPAPAEAIAPESAPAKPKRKRAAKKSV